MLSCLHLAQVLCDFSFQTAALSMLVNPRRNALDDQKTCEDGENNKQIKIFFRHCPCVSVKDRAMPRPLRNGQRTVQIGGGVLKCLQDGSLRMPLFFLVRYTNGRFGPLVRLWLQDLT